jgi:hypothetical protein
VEDDVRAMFELLRAEMRDEHDETRRHFDTVAERLEGKIDVVAEGVITVNQRVDRLEVVMYSEFREIRSILDGVSLE